MCGAPERGFDTPDDDRKSGEGLPQEVGIDDDRPVGTCTGLAAGGVGVVVAFLAEGGVVGQHRIDGPGGNPREESGPAHAQHIFRRVPAWLRHDARAVAVGHQPASEKGGGEGRVVDVGVAGDEQHVQRIPPYGVHLGTRHGQEAGLGEGGTKAERVGLHPFSIGVRRVGSKQVAIAGRIAQYARDDIRPTHGKHGAASEG